MIALPMSVDRWMYFRRLDGLGDEVDGVYTIGWRFTDDWAEPWTVRFNQFKSNSSQSVRGARAVAKIALAELLKRQGWAASETGIVAALSSSDTKTDPAKPLPITVAACGTKLGITYLPNLLTKNAHRPLHSLSNASERAAELEKADYRSLQVSGPLKRILFVDDFVTRGDTLTAVAKAIKKQAPTIKVVGIALGKTERKSYASGFGYELSNNHIPVEWGKEWDAK